MTFEYWWQQHNYSEEIKETCREAYNAGVEDNFLHANRELKDRDVIINFLKKELQKKTYCRQVMKRQYRELKQKYNALLKKEGEKMTVKEYRANFKKKEKENKGLWTCLICGKTYAPMWFEEIKIGNSPIRYCKWCRESVMENIIKNKLEQLK